MPNRVASVRRNRGCSAKYRGHRNKPTYLPRSGCEGGQVVKMGDGNYYTAIVKELKFYLILERQACLILPFGPRYRMHCAFFSLSYSTSSWLVKVVT